MAPAVAARQGGLAIFFSAYGGAAFCCRRHPPQLPLQFLRHLLAKRNVHQQVLDQESCYRAM